MAGVVAGLTIWRVLRWIRRAAVFFVAAVVVYVAVTAVQVWLTSRRSDPHKADAIIVMGAAQDNGVPTPDLRARLEDAYGLYERHLAPRIVLTGSKQPGDAYTEAQSGARYLESRSPAVPASALVEVGGRDSWANLSQAATALKPYGARTVLIATDGFHEARCLAIAGPLGLVASPVPATSSPIRGWAAFPYFAKETAGVALGRIIGFNHLETFHEAWHRGPLTARALGSARLSSTRSGVV